MAVAEVNCEPILANYEYRRYEYVGAIALRDYLLFVEHRDRTVFAKHGATFSFGGTKGEIFCAHE